MKVTPNNRPAENIAEAAAADFLTLVSSLAPSVDHDNPSHHG
ncbi:hypothetical protein [Nocardia tengchongensis]